MLIKRIEGSTRQLGAPADWDGKDMSCGVLPILDVQTAEGNFMFSAWEPTPPELEALNKGANIVLGVRGTAHPVVSLQVAADIAVKHPDDVAVDQFAEVMKAKLADARAKGRSGWQECDPAELSYMLREHVEKGDPRDVANFCMFLWILGKPIGDARPVVGLQLTPLDGIQVWIDAYTNAANGPHFMGHGRIVQLLREYLALRKLLAQRTPPPLPETHYNGSGDGSEPLYTADMLHLYASQYAASLALPASSAPEGYVLMPRRLTAENGAKAALSGEFAEKATYHCSQCNHEEPDDGCEECNGQGSYQVDVPIEWDTIKRIYDKAVEELASSSPAVAQPVAFREVAADGTPITDWIDGSLPPNTPPLHPGATIQFAYGAQVAEPIAWESTTPAYAKYITDARYQQLHPGFKPWFKPYRCSQCSAPATAAFPDALTPELTYVLGMPNFRCAPYAEIFRGAGHDIPRKAEAEQAFVIHRMARAVLQHGAGWDAAFAAELHAAADSAKAAAAAGPQKGGA
ncbi:hypothetical protein [Herbaspirillum huttiense]|uniref:hypothetical protein n=1 Tax=Herbaspirillum huttiense TaxID=863372 RepID=UPI001F0F7849|nr:hypothetical protein [Herbaspirillum huttiense]